MRCDRNTLKRITWAACSAATLYAAAYCCLRVQDRLIVYRGEVLYGRWTTSNPLFSHPLSFRSFEVSSRPEVFFAPLAHLESIAFRLLGRRSSIDYHSGTVPIHGEIDQNDLASRVPPQLSRYKLLGGWYDHIEWSDRESYHFVYEASELTPDALRSLVVQDLTDSGVIDDRGLSASKTIGGFVFPTRCIRERCVGDGGHWREVLFDGNQNLLCLTIGVDD